MNGRRLPLKIIEINVGAEFHGLMETTDRDIAAEIVDYLARKWRRLQAGDQTAAPTPALIDGLPHDVPGAAPAARTMPRA